MAIKRFFMSAVQPSDDGSCHRYVLREVVLSTAGAGEYKPVLAGPTIEGPPYQGPCDGEAADGLDEVLRLARDTLPECDEMFHVRHREDIQAAARLLPEELASFRIHSRIARARAAQIVEAVGMAEIEFASRLMDLPPMAEGDRLYCVWDGGRCCVGGMVVRNSEVIRTTVARGSPGGFETRFPGLAEAVMEGFAARAGVQMTA